MKKKTRDLLILVVLVLIILYLCGCFSFMGLDSPVDMSSKKVATKEVATKEVVAPVSANKAILYFNPRCPHCVHFMPVWTDFMNKMKGKIEVVSVDCSENPNLCMGVRGVPHIVLSKNGKEAAYEGERSVEAIEKFYNSL